MQTLFPPALRQDISKLTCIRRGNTVSSETRPGLIIGAGVYQYELNGQFLQWGKILTEPEIEWLASEISDWLGIPITR